MATDEVRRFYDDNADVEWVRVEDAYSRIEYLSTLRLIEWYFPASGRVIDIGGGPGRYSIEMLRRGYAVTLFDLSEKELAIAREEIDKAGLHAEAVLHGDARDLRGVPDASYDAGLLMGPLYHLHNAADRGAALRELFRVMKPGAIAIAAYLNTWGLIRTGVHDFPEQFADAAFGQRMLDEGTLGIWYWTNPQRAQAEVAAAGFEVISYAGAEGCVGGIRTLIRAVSKSHPDAYENLVQLAVETSEMPHFRDGADHMQVVLRKPG